MFVRKKKNKSGTISVVVIDKSHGGFKEVKNYYAFMPMSGFVPMVVSCR